MRDLERDEAQSILDDMDVSLNFIIPLLKSERCLSVCALFHPEWFLRSSWTDFLQTWYTDEVPWGLDTYKTDFGSVSQYGNDGYFLSDVDIFLS